MKGQIEIPGDGTTLFTSKQSVFIVENFCLLEGSNLDFTTTKSVFKTMNQLRCDSKSSTPFSTIFCSSFLFTSFSNGYVENSIYTFGQLFGTQTLSSMQCDTIYKSYDQYHRQDVGGVLAQCTKNGK